ncbi:universal stress protein [Salinicola rhizosphaerae]|uniref:Universal stress protein YxiE n=1 Tax=Salinicola rhizosphaerae TaxID=1443141 RepID=A0ABQ3DVM6_9GAMM|nr:universal stress protein [Salinicola rhizosphaerae]GHB15164.1 universal stress protein YxiE [Salinicola rhizosphaerae]
MTRQILVPIDGSESAAKALEHACLLQRADGATIHLLHIPEVPVAQDALGRKTGATPLDYTPARAREQGENLLRQAWQATGSHDGSVRFLVEDGHPAQVIVAQARSLNIDLIVMGSRGLSDLRGLMVGSVSHKVTHVAPCQVITLHVPE